ncbi:hypothetical protein EAE96_007937 [Botrytis aclada]|nr:hypothetical protein EAE96_007937 [Botrytis aclada]
MYRDFLRSSTKSSRDLVLRRTGSGYRYRCFGGHRTGIGIESQSPSRTRNQSCDRGIGLGLAGGVCTRAYSFLHRGGFTRENPTVMENARAMDMAGSAEQGVAVEVGDEGNAKAGRAGKGGRGGKGKVAAAGAGAGQNREMLVSKALSKLLRHAAESEGVRLDGEGFARLDLVMQWPRLKSLKPTFADIRTAVTDNAKQRFSMKPNPSLLEPPSPSSENPEDWMIRANQGHSIAIDSAALLVPITLEAGNVPETCVHGTYFAFYEEILKSGGLKKMGRNHVHFGTGVPEDGGVVSGMRGDAEVLIYVDVKRCLEEEPQVKWWVSENGVVLTEGDGEGVVATRFWTKVVGRREGGLLWEDGVEVADLEEGLRNRKAPMGKGGRGGGGGRGGRGGGRGRGRGKEGRGGRGGGRGGKNLDGNTETSIEETKPVAES